MFIGVGLKVLSARAVLILTLVLAFSLFCWAMWDPTWNRIAAATIFAVLALLPAYRLDSSKREDREIVTPDEE